MFAQPHCLKHFAVIFLFYLVFPFLMWPDRSKVDPLGAPLNAWPDGQIWKSVFHILCICKSKLKSLIKYYRKMQL